MNWRQHEENPSWLTGRPKLSSNAQFLLRFVYPAISRDDAKANHFVGAHQRQEH